MSASAADGVGVLAPAGQNSARPRAAAALLRRAGGRDTNKRRGRLDYSVPERDAASRGGCAINGDGGLPAGAGLL